MNAMNAMNTTEAMGPERAFEAAFGKPPAAVARAPGRVNLLGEHTDYNDGFVLPARIPQETTVALGPSDDGRYHLLAAELGDEQVVLAPGEAPPRGFALYVIGVIRLLEREGHKAPPLSVRISSTVPMGAGLSSSAALEVATLRALYALLGLEPDPVRIAELAQKAEIEFAGVRCGIMDQMASSLARDDSLLFLDTRTLARSLVPLPAGSAVLVIDSGAPRTLAESGYNERRAQCEEAATRLGVRALRDIDDPARAESLPEPLRRRARHVITENARVLIAAQGVSKEAFGALMNASHASLRDDYEVSVPALDTLVAILQTMPMTPVTPMTPMTTPGVFGARLTGAGFGGAVVALVAAGEERAIGERALARYAEAGHRGRLLVPAASG
jgi:galactokinase